MVFHVSEGEWVTESADAAATSRPLPFGLGRMADERLAQLVMAGRERAFAVLYERYHQPLYRYCRSMLRNDQDAQDVLQSTFASALAALQQGKRNAPFRPWLFRIAHNEAITLIRRRRDAGQEITEAMLPPVASASEEADDRARLALLLADLAQLPERQRAALLMRELSGLSHAEISVALATSLSAAKQAIFDARTALTQFAEGRALACEDVRRRISETDGRVLRSRRMRAHLRDCAGCAAFAAGIPQRRSDLKAIAPLLPPAASAALLARVGSAASAHGGGAGGATASTAGKLGTTALAAKAAVGATVLVSAAAGVGMLPDVLPLPARASTPSAHNASVTPVPASSVGFFAAGAPAAAAPHVRSPMGVGLPAAVLPRSTAQSVSARSGRRHGGPGTPRASSASGQAASSLPAGAHGQSALTHGNSGQAHGKSGQAHGKSGQAHGKSGQAHGKSGQAHGKSGLPHGHSSQAPGHTDAAGTGSAAPHPAKPSHDSPGRAGTAGKSTSSPGHAHKNSPATTNQTARVTPPTAAAAGSPKAAKSKVDAAAAAGSGDVALPASPSAAHAK